MHPGALADAREVHHTHAVRQRLSLLGACQARPPDSHFQERVRLHATSVGITTLAVLESCNRRLAAEAPGQGLDGGRVGVQDGVKLPIMAEERFYKQLDDPGVPRGCPLPEDRVEGTWVWGGVPEKLGLSICQQANAPLSSGWTEE